jgi:hypothetical protein
MASEKALSYATLALAVSLQEWSQLGLGTDPVTSAATMDHAAVVTRAAALLSIRIVALLAPLGTFANLSTTQVCRQVLLKPRVWPASVTDATLELVHEWCVRILTGYKDVPYHNVHHAYHVIVSANKLLDMLLLVDNTKNKSAPPAYGLRHDPMSLLALIFAAIVHDVEHQVGSVLVRMINVGSSLFSHAMFP